MVKRKNSASDGESGSRGSGEAESSRSPSSEIEDKPNISSPTVTPKVEDPDLSSSSDDGDDDWKKSGSKKAKKKKSSKSNNKRVKREDDEKEEGEVDDDEEDDEASHIRKLNSLGADDALDSDDDAFTEEFNDGYDENLMGDEDDQKRLAMMTEKEREEELFHRSEKREALKTRFEIQKKLRAQKKAEKQRQQRKKGDKNKDIPFTETSLRSEARRRELDNKNAKKSALDALKEKREKKQVKIQQKLRAADVYSDDSDSSDSDSGGRKRRSSSSSSSGSSSSDSDSDDGKRGRDSRRDSDDDARDEDYVFTLAECNSIQITRFDCEKWCHTPFFPNTVKDGIIRLGIGPKRMPDGSLGPPQYRVCQVMEVVEKENAVYTLEGKNSKTKTNKHLKLKHVKDQRDFKMEFVSNMPVDEKEFQFWKEGMEKEYLPLPTRSSVVKKREELNTARNYRMTDADIEFIVKEKEKYNSSPKNFAMRKTQLTNLKNQAELNNDEVEVIRLSKELDELEEYAKELDKKRTNSIAAISYINERNRIRNIAEAEKAIMEESKREAASKFDDPFKRRKCAPQLMTTKFIKKEFKSEPGSPANGQLLGVIPPIDAKDASSTSLPDGLAKVKVESDAEPIDAKPLLNSAGVVITQPSVVKTRPESPSRNPDERKGDDLFDAHDFDIQIEFDIGATIPNVPITVKSEPNADVKPPPVTNRRSLNLEDYKKRKGLI